LLIAEKVISLLWLHHGISFKTGTPIVPSSSNTGAEMVIWLPLTGAAETKINTFNITGLIAQILPVDIGIKGRIEAVCEQRGGRKVWLRIFTIGHVNTET
jgi:hypothetical protein